MTDASGAVTQHTSRALYRVRPAGLLLKLIGGFSDKLLRFISSCLSDNLLFVAVAPEGSILLQTVFLYYVNDFPEDMCNTAIYSGDSTHLIIDPVSDVWQQL